jgi:hypothetical protein
MSDTSYFDAYMKGERSSSYRRKIRNMQLLEYMKFFTERRYVRSYSEGEGFSNPCQEVFIRESIERVESTLRWT